MPIEWKCERQSSYCQDQHQSRWRARPPKPQRSSGAFQFSFQFATEVFERLKQLVCDLVPLLAIFAQGFADNLLKLSGSTRDKFRERQWLRFKNRRHHLSWRVAGEWHMPSYHFIKDHAQTPDIGALIN